MVTNPGRNRLLSLVLFLAACAAPARAVTVYDLAADPAPVLPSVVDTMDSPVYFTNLGGSGGPATGEVDTLRIGQYSQLHLGYDNAAVAADDITVKVAGDVSVDGKLFLGKDATVNRPGLPNAAAAKAVDLEASGALFVNRGGEVVLNGHSDGTGGDEKKYATVAADSVVVAGGALTLEDHSLLKTGTGVFGGTPGNYSVAVRNGGALTLNSGVPALIVVETPPLPGSTGVDRTWQNADNSAWEFRGIDTTAGGGGILVESGGVLAAGNAGGAIQGVAGQRVDVAKGGLLDAGRGSILVGGASAVAIAGGYRAGYDAGTKAATHLVAENGTVTFAAGSSMGMSRALQRHLNTGGQEAWDAANLVQGRDGVVFEGGIPAVLQTGMGRYGLEMKTDAESGHAYVGVKSAENVVTGSRSEGDRDTFRNNMQDLWNPGRMNRDQADNIYNLTVVETPTVEAYGESGRLNQAILEAMVDGRDQAVQGYGGVVDRGIFEMYNGGAQWGVNTVAFNTAGEFMAGLDRRVERVGAEMDRLGEGWGGATVYASSGAYGSACGAAPDGFDRRFWIGGFGRNEEATLDYGISGYRYRPRGFMAGYDKVVGSFALGGAVAYGKGDYEDRAAQSNDSKIASYSAGLYATYHASNGLYATAHAAYSHLDNDLSDVRGGLRRTADHSGYAWSAGARLGYDKLLSDRMTLSPSAGLQRVQAVGRAHDESLDGVGVLRVGEVRRDSTMVPVDLTLGYDLVRGPSAILRLTGNLGYAYDLDGDGLDGAFSYDGLAGATSMRVADREAGRHRFNAGAGLLFTGSRIDFGARYDFFKRSEQTSHQARGSLGVKF